MFTVGRQYEIEKKHAPESYRYRYRRYGNLKSHHHPSPGTMLTGSVVQPLHKDPAAASASQEVGYGSGSGLVRVSSHLLRRKL